MSPPRAKSNVKRYGRQSSALDPLNGQGKTTLLITRPLPADGLQQHVPVVSNESSPLRKSARAYVYRRNNVYKRNNVSVDDPRGKSKYINFSLLREAFLIKSADRKRKRSPNRNYKTEAREVDHPLSQHKDEPDQKRQRIQPANFADKDTSSQAAVNKTGNSNAHLHHWALEGNWPLEYFDQDSNMSQILTRKRSTPSLSNKQSDTTGVSLREGKNPAVKSRRYEQILESASIYMGQPESHLRITDIDKALCRKLLDTEQSAPRDSLFEDDLFETTCEDIRNRNEARVIQDIGRLIVPAPEELARRGVTHLKHLIETVDESWIKSIPLVHGPRPQPDFSVGFKSSAFTSDQLKKLKPYVGNWQTTSRIMAIDEMYFPFLTSEVKCGNEALNIADRQNVHSASVAANAVIEIYRAVSRQDELHRKILTFSVSHDNMAVRIYGHYALINGKDTSFYRYSIKEFYFTSENGKEKWSAYTFTLNVYNEFRQIHHDRITSVVDQLPDPEVFLVKPLSQQSNAESFEQGDSQSTAAYSQETTPRLASSQTSEPVFKKPKGKGIE